MSSRALRVLHLNLSSGGLGRYGALFARSLAKRGNVEVLSVFNSTLGYSELVRKITAGVEKIEMPVQTYAQRGKLGLSLRKIVKSWQPNIVHDTAGSGYAWAVIASALAVRDVPLLITEHDPEPHLGMGSSLHSWLARLLIRRLGDQVFVHGPQGRDVLIRQGMAPSKVTVIRHGHLSPLFDQSPPGSIKRESRTVLFFGALRPNKGFHLLIQIADRIHEDYPDAKFIVAGSPNVARDLSKSGWPEKLERLSEEMSIRPYFEVHDRFIPDEEVAVFFRRASITILPYLDATQSGVAMIAMPLGSVVVATRVGDLPFTIEDGVTGFLVDPDVDSIANGLRFAFSHPSELEKVRQGAKAWVERECDWERIANQVVAKYFKLLCGM